MTETLITLVYLLTAACFIIGLKWLSSPRTARKGNILAASGALIAVVATLFAQQILNPIELAAGLAIGSAIGVWLARKVAMTEMPELVAALNGFGGGASALVAIAELIKFAGENPSVGPEALLAVSGAISILFGAVTFSGSGIAYGKLAGKISGNPLTFPGIRIITVLALIGVVVCTVMLVGTPGIPAALLVLIGLSLLLGVLLVLPIGGADMPVVVALLNSYTGVALAAAGFVLVNHALIISGALIGASGFILTMLMCDAMNRSLLNVLLGGFGGTASGGGTGASTEGLSVRSTTADDVAILMSYARKVIVIPGYGLAVAQAQHEVREMADLLIAEGVEVKYAVHPVAGRMPGHMNVLLAEANVPYDQLFDMDSINADFDTADVAIVIGANDVVNPAARTDTTSPIYGMPILNADRAANVIVLKRSMNPGYAGIDNLLFYQDNTQMLFGDAKDSLAGIVAELKNL